MERFFVFILVAAVFVFGGCESSPQGADGAAEGLSAAEASEDQAPYTGDGGAGKSITILPINGRGLTKDQNILLETMQGEFMANFSNYSAIEVFDRMNLEANYKEIYAGWYDDNSKEMDLGKLPPTDYFMNGRVAKTETGYALQIQISNTSDKRLAVPSYSGTCTSAELNDFTGAKRASRDQLEKLLGKLGSKLTEQAKTELDAAATQQAVEAQVALSKGIEAMRKGTMVEAQSYFIQAQAADPQLAEAASRVNIMSRDISSGDIGESARNRQAWHDDWEKRLAECEKTVMDYMNKTPFPAYLVYSTAIKEEGQDYNRKTMNLSCGEIALYVASESWPAPVMGVVDAVYAGLRATKMAEEWGFGSWPGRSVSRGFALGERIPSYEIEVQLLNNKGEVIAKQGVSLRAGWSTGFDGGRTTARKSQSSSALRFNNVDVNKVSNPLSIKIAKLNGADVEKTAKANSVSVMTVDEYKKTSAYFVANNCEFNAGVLTKCTGDVRAIGGVLPAWFNGQAVTGIGDEMFIFTGTRYLGGSETTEEIEYNRSRRSRIVVPDSVTSIGAGAFAKERVGNPLAVIPLYNLYLGAQGKLNLYEYPDGFSVSLPANVGLAMRPGVMDSLADSYNGNGRKAGTYAWDGESWRYSARR
ncbi:MAG: hypothetical protein LBT33_08250 [Spirochaetia bacterium]|nr:hypothetical protein [Spirochaetia bacterium]